jgi:hypothetical protein
MMHRQSMRSPLRRRLLSQSEAASDELTVPNMAELVRASISWLDLKVFAIPSRRFTELHATMISFVC